MSVIRFCIFLSLLISAMAQSPAELYQTNCKNCHGINGEGIPPAIPPLKNSDFLAKNRETSIRAVLEGLSGKIHVNGKEYNAIMPAIPLDDANVVKVLNYVRKTFNKLPGDITEPEVAKIRMTTKYPTFMQQVKAVLNIGLPQAPEGWEIELSAELDFSPTRIANAGNNQLLMISRFGDIHLLNVKTRELKKLLVGKDYLSRGSKYVGVTKGIGLDNKRRLYITNDYIVKDRSLPYDIDRVRIYRTAPLPEVITDLPKPERWFEVAIPAGVGPYNHGISHIEQGPDGWMYVSFGSRTNAGETGNMSRRAKSREHELSAAIWRLKDNNDEKPKFEVYARGFRNPYGFCFDKQGRMFASENGPDKDIVTELNLVEQGKHYGFPYMFADLTENPHEESPKYEGNETFVKPLLNMGPDGIVPLEGNQKPMSSFTAHCVPVGMTYLDDRFPKDMKNTMLMARFGGFWPVNGITTGFDILQIKYNEDNTITSKKLVSNLARPIDVDTMNIDGEAAIIIAEYCRGRSIAEGLTHPGRILILRQK
ncbi:MAG: PQQ-dependent sugar dehydrogenase [Lentisphaerales bacterium]|nr:PQQ-dependent sugar dehydrogenase [Lentisphaerales bacterium]